jgi:hypothetical protein
VNFKIEVGVIVEMKVIWLRKQYRADLEYKSTSQKSQAAWTIQSHAVALKQYLQGKSQAIAALNRLEQIGGEISRAIREGNFEKVQKLAEDASSEKSVVAQAMSSAQNVPDEARQLFLKMSEAIQALGGY